MSLTGVFGEEEDFAIAPGKWSIRQIVAHLADCELVGAHRMRQIVAEDNPTLIASIRTRGRVTSIIAPQTQAVARYASPPSRENYELLKDLPDTAFARTGNHSERGMVTLRDLLQGYAEHVESHAEQLQRIREEYKKVKVKK